MRRLLLLSLGFIGLSMFGMGQSFQAKFEGLISTRDTAGMRILLAQWEAADTIDPEMYVAYANYFLLRSKQEIMTLGQNPEGKEALGLKDPNNPDGEPAAFLYSSTQYDPSLIAQAFAYLDRGIELFPRRLDLRFGKIHLLGELDRYAAYTEAVVGTVAYSAVIQNQWLWSGNTPLKQGRAEMLDVIQEYFSHLYYQDDPALYGHMQEIAEAVLRQSPDHVPSLSNLSIVHMLRADFEAALVPLLKAETLAPTDAIVLGNIAHCYKNLGNKKKAIAYYERTAKHGDAETKSYAEEQIEELKR